MRMIRKEPRASDGWSGADGDVAFQLFSCGMVWDGNLSSKSSRDHFVAEGYAVRHEGMQCLTGKGIIHFLTTPHIWVSAWNRYRRWKSNPFIADAAKVKRAMS